MAKVRGSLTGAGVWILTVCFLTVSVAVETAYSWRIGLTDPYYLVKLVGWSLLVAGAVQVRTTRLFAGLAFLAAGWGWLAANFWRAVADRFSHLAAGRTLRLGSIELWFAGSCLLVCLIGLSWCLTMTLGRAQSD